jgi:phosphate-selective porin OprO/OprP
MITTLLVGSSSCVFTSAVQAGSSGANTADAKIQALEAEIQNLSSQVEDLKRSTKDEKDQSAEVQKQQAEIQKRQTSAVKVTIDNGRPVIASADGNFTFAVRAVLQTDWGYYMQSAAATKLPTTYGPDFSSGTNLRRAEIGFQGKVFGDWSYYFLYEFGNPTTEAPGHILNSYIQYDGLAPWGFRIGVYAPPSNLEDGTAGADLMFFERNSPSNMQRGIAGSEGRDAISILYMGDRLFGALSFTGGKVQDTAVFDEQQALVGRTSYLLYSDSDAHLLVGANGTYVIKLPDAVANGSATLATVPGGTALATATLSDLPEFSVDSNGYKLANTGALPANHISQWGLETAGNYQNFYGQAGYYGFQVSRTPVAYTVFSAANTSGTTVVRPTSNNFSAWYLQSSWILTGESKAYVPATGTFTTPKPAQPFSLSKGDWGAWELAARYSDLNLNDLVSNTSNIVTGWTATSKTYTYYNTVRGGDQRIITLGLNWYPNNAVRFLLDYQLIGVSRLQTPATVATLGTPALPAVNGGQNLQTVALRAQIAF